MVIPDRSMRLIAFRRGLIPAVCARRRVMRRVRARLRFSQRGWSARRRHNRAGRPFRMRGTGRRGPVPDDGGQGSVRDAARRPAGGTVGGRHGADAW